MNILIIKIGALGDVLRTSFIAQAIHEQYLKNTPQIYWVTSPDAKSLLENNKFISHLVYPNSKAKLSNKRWDLIINLEEDVENCKFVSSLNYERMIGFYYKDGKILPTKTAREWFNMSALGKKPENDFLKKNNVKTHRQIISEIIGINRWDRYEPFLKLSSFQKRTAYNFLRKNNLSVGDKIIGINTGSAGRWPKQLPIKKTVQLIKELSKKFGSKIILFGGPNEIERNKQIVSQTNSLIIDAGCKNSLEDFQALISICYLFITTDTLGLHISLALKRKTICLVGPTSSSELDMYSLGEKIVAKSKCTCCYKPDCKSMERIDILEIINTAKKLLHEKISLVITSFNDPSIKRAIDSAINQKTNFSYNIIVSAPDKQTLDVARKFKNLSVVNDPGKGKSFALNFLFKQIDSDIIILTDGDVFISEDSLEEIIPYFDNPLIGCVSGRPVPLENKKTKYGYWANFLFEAAHRIRKYSFKKNSFIECSGYLFAFRKKIIQSIPLDIAEDLIIPHIFWEKGYEIGYSENSKVFVKNANNFNDWIKQKVRTSKAHYALGKYVSIGNDKRVKTLRNEFGRGIKMIFSYPSKFKEFFWTIELAFARFFMWVIVFLDTRFKNKNYNDSWERINSTK